MTITALPLHLRILRPLIFAAGGALALAAAPVYALDVDIGPVGVDVSLGGDSVADVGVSVGNAVDADVSVANGTNVADVGVSVGSSVGATATVGGSSTATANATVGGIGATATALGSSGTVVPGTACTGGAACLVVGPTTTATAVPPGTGTPTGTLRPGTSVAVSTSGKMLPARISGPFTCAKAGNTTAFDGLPLVDRNNAFLGYVHSAQIGSDGAIRSVRVKTVDSACATIANGGFSASGGAVRGGFAVR